MCLRVVASVFGSPRFVTTWEITDNALEQTALQSNDALLIMDEISEVKSQDKAGDVAYMLANGEGKND